MLNSFNFISKYSTKIKYIKKYHKTKEKSGPVIEITNQRICNFLLIEGITHVHVHELSIIQVMIVLQEFQ